MERDSIIPAIIEILRDTCYIFNMSFGLCYDFIFA